MTGVLLTIKLAITKRIHLMKRVSAVLITIVVSAFPFLYFDHVVAAAAAVVVVSVALVLFLL